MGSYFRKQLEDYLSTLDVKADAVLDVGGLQLPVKDRVASWKVKDYKILDSEKAMKGEKADIVADLSRSLDYHAQVNDLMETFDVVFCLEVMEYVHDPMQALRNVHQFLKPGGTAYISFPFVYPMHPPEDTDFLRYTEHGVTKMLKEAGFRNAPAIHVRRAGPGRSTLKRFFDEEGMKYRRDDLSYLDHIGYIARVTKNPL